MLVIFAYHRRFLGIVNVTLIVDDVESLLRLLSFNRLSLALLELPQSRLKLVSAPPVAWWEPRGFRNIFEFGLSYLLSSGKMYCPDVS